MKKSTTLIAGVVSGVALALAAAVYAHPYDGMGQGYGHGMGMGMGYGFGPGMGAGPGYGPMAGFDPSATVESRLGALKAELKITASQEAAWKAYADQAKQQAASMPALHAQMNADAMTAPERRALHTALMQQRISAMAAMDTAFNALYAVLTPEQKAIADQGFGMMGQHGMRFGRRPG